MDYLNLFLSNKKINNYYIYESYCKDIYIFEIIQPHLINNKINLKLKIYHTYIKIIKHKIKYLMLYYFCA